MSNSAVSPDRIEVAVPATATYGATLRLVASAIGADAGWDVDDIDDLKLALTEVLSIVSVQPEVERVCVGFSMQAGEVTVQLRLEPAIPLEPPDGLAGIILGAVMDRVDWRSDGATLWKRPRDWSGGA